MNPGPVRRRLSIGWRVSRAVLGVFGGWLFLAQVASAQAPVGTVADVGAAKLASELALGQRIYREGLGATGEPLLAVGAAQMRLSGKMVACAVCHRRSGYGGSEGQFVVRSITGPALRQEQSVAQHSPRIKAMLGTSQRPPYTEALLDRAIRGGIDAAGKPLDPVMPRYALSDVEARALSAYLFSLSSTPSPGVDDQEIHFATVLQPGVAAEKRRAMLDIMQAFVKDKDANVRSEEQRREAGTMRMYRAYRKWVLHVWELSGPSDTWAAQLEAYQAQQPVFALIGGLGNASWRPVHEFSERHEIPCVFPQTDLPVVAGPGHYTFYFTRGVTLEAEVLARHLRDQGGGRVVQVHRRGEASATAAAALRAALEPGIELEDRLLDGPADAAFWQSVAATKPAALVLWLAADELDRLPAWRDGATPVYLSFDLLGGKRPEALVKAGADLRLVYPSDLAPRHDARLLRNKLWLHTKGLPATDEAVQVNTQFAMTVVSDVIGHIADSFSRDYFVERIEHVVAQTPMPSLFPQVSLGPGQRFAAKGASVVRLLEGEKAGLKALSGWIVP